MVFWPTRTTSATKITKTTRPLGWRPGSVFRPHWSHGVSVGNLWRGRGASLILWLLLAFWEGGGQATFTKSCHFCEICSQHHNIMNVLAQSRFGLSRRSCESAQSTQVSAQDEPIARYQLSVVGPDGTKATPAAMPRGPISCH